MSDLSQLFGNIAGALGSQATGGSQGLQQFMASVYRKQELDESRRIKEDDRRSEQAFTLRRDRLNRAHDKEMLQEKLQGEASTGPKAQIDQQTNSLVTQISGAMAAGDAASREANAFLQLLKDNGYAPKDYIPVTNTPNGRAILASHIKPYVTEIGAPAAREAFQKGGKAIEKRAEEWARLTGRSMRPDENADDLIALQRTSAAAETKMNAATNNIAVIANEMESFGNVTKDTTSTSVQEEAVRIGTTLQKIKNDLADIRKNNPQLFAPGAQGSDKLKALEIQIESRLALFEKSKDLATARLQGKQDLGTTGRPIVNELGYGGQMTEDGHPAEAAEREDYFASASYTKDSAQFDSVFRALNSLDAGELKAFPGADKLTAWFNQGPHKAGAGRISTLKELFDQQFKGNLEEAAEATELIKGIFSVNPEIVTATTNASRADKADLQRAYQEVQAIGNQIGTGFGISNADIDAIRTKYGEKMTVDTGGGGSKEYYRWVPQTENNPGTLGAWFADPHSKAMSELADVVMETSPVFMETGMHLGRPISAYGIYGSEIENASGYVVEERTKQVAVAMSLNADQLNRLEVEVSKRDPRVYKLSDNPVPMSLPKGASPTVEGIAGESPPNTHGFNLPPEKRVAVNNSIDHYLFSSGTYSSVAKRNAALSRIKEVSAAPRDVTGNKFNSMAYTNEEANTKLMTLLDFSDMFRELGDRFLGGDHYTLHGEKPDARYPRKDLDPTYLTGKESFARKYKEAAGGNFDQKIHDKFALADAMRASTGGRGWGGESKKYTTYNSGDQDKLASRNLLVNTLKGLTYDDAWNYFIEGKGIPWGLVQGVSDAEEWAPPELVSAESQLAFKEDRLALENDLLKIKRADKTPRFGFHFDTDKLEPIDEAYFKLQETKLVQKQEELESYERLVREGYDMSRVDRLLTSVLEHATVKDGPSLYARIDPGSTAGKLWLAEMAGDDFDKIENMFTQGAYTSQLHRIRDAKTMRDAIVALTDLIKDNHVAALAKAEQGGSVAMKDKGIGRKVLARRIGEYVNTYDSIEAALAAKRYDSGGKVTVYDLNEDMGRWLQAKGFSNADLTAQNNMAFGAFLRSRR